MIGRLAALALVLLALAPPAAAQHASGSWTRAWTASQWQAAGKDVVTVENVTIRAQVRVGAGGGKIRLRLANDYGPALRIGAATVRVPGGLPVRVTFGGKSATTLLQGAPFVSDPIAMPVDPFELVEVSLYLPDKVDLATVHAASGAPTDISAPGDNSNVAFEPIRRSNTRPLIAGIDVLTIKPRPVVVAFGDSITDNVGCANDATPRCRWSDVLGRRLAAAGKPHVVVTQAISGNRILTPGSGPSALARLDRDVLAVPGVSHIVLLEGINDIGNSGLERNGATSPKISADALIAGYRQIVLRAHARGVKVIALTILPFEGAFYYSPEREAMRQSVNRWIRGSGVFDGVVDMEKVVADRANPRRLATELQGGDNLHPDGRGETRMGEAIPIGLFRQGK